MLLYDLVDAFEKAKLKYALVGGYAMALHGIIRATMDIDLVLNLQEKDFVSAEKALQSIGLQSRLPVRAKEVFVMRKEYIENRNLIAWSFVDFKNPTRQIDIIIVEDLNKMKVVKIPLAGRKVSTASLEELIRMKKKSGRPQDLVDIQNIEEKLNGQKK